MKLNLNFYEIKNLILYSIKQQINLFLLLTAPVIGNFTDEEFMGPSGSQDNSEYPFQRDEVARVPFSRDRNNYMPSGKLIQSTCFLF